MVNDAKKRFYIEEQLSEHMGETPEGFLIVTDVPIARTGEQIYKADEVPIEPNSSGLVTIKRTEEEVFKPDAIKSFESKPFTLDHPKEMVTPENWKEYAHGEVTNIRRGVGEFVNFLIADIIVKTQKAIEMIRGGMRQISCGYDAEYVQLEKGVGMQTDITGNHVALVMKGRAGNRCAISDKECSGCGNCKCNPKLKNLYKEDEDAMKFKAKLKGVYKQRILDEDFKKLPDDEKADKLADDAVEAVEAEGADPDNLPQKDADEEDPNEMEKDRKTKDDDQFTKLDSKIDRLIGIIEKFVEAASSIKEAVGADADPDPADDPQNMDGDDPDENLENQDADPANPDKVEKPENQDSDEDPDENLNDDADPEDEEKKAAAACDSMWNDISYRADLLYPGIRLAKPAKDHAKSLEKLRQKALKYALTNDAAIAGMIDVKDVGKLTGKALQIAFRAASDFTRDKNNRSVRDSIITDTGKVVNTIKGIQQRNREFWNSKNK